MLLDDLKTLLAEVLGLGPAAAALTERSALLGAVPELDSMAVVQLIAALEQRFGIVIDDDEIGASLFETVGSLLRFVEQKQAE